MSAFRAIVVDDNERYRDEAVARLVAAGIPDNNIQQTDSVEEAKQFAPGVDLIILDNLITRSKSKEPESYWVELLVPLRRMHPSATIVLVSKRDDASLRTDIKNINVATEHLLETDPLLIYLFKGNPQVYGPDVAASPQHFKQLQEIVGQLVLCMDFQRQLQCVLVTSAFQAVRHLLDTNLASLVTRLADHQARTEYLNFKGKDDTYLMDVIAEGILSDRILPLMHEMGVVICTEEAGVHNDLYHRIPDPNFFIFSDPFDGSSRFRDAANSLKDVGSAKKTLQDVLADRSLLNAWPCGPTSLNSPMISMVLAERHRVVGAVLINLFTFDVYLSTNSGNYTKNYASSFMNGTEETSSQASEAVSHLINDLEGIGPWKEAGWQQISFKSMNNGVIPSLFLCSLGTVDRKEKFKRSWINEHAELCVHPLIPEKYDWVDSFNHRYKQRDFTPGPGRVLFLTDTDQRRQYDDEALEGGTYGCILSAGEPITEWIGWFAFLRHATGISAFCLRERPQEINMGKETTEQRSVPEAKPQPACTHQRPGDPANISALPNELLSMFRDGYMDISVLHTAYASNMRRYKDTIAIVYDDDEAWQKQITRDDGKPRFFKVPLMQIP